MAGIGFLMRRFGSIQKQESELPEDGFVLYDGIKSDGQSYIVIPNFTIKRDDTIILHYSGANVQKMQLAFGMRSSEKGVFFAIDYNLRAYFGEFSNAGTPVESLDGTGYNQPNTIFRTDIGYSVASGGIRRRFYINGIGQKATMPGDLEETLTHDLYVLTCNIAGEKVVDSRFFQGVIHSLKIVSYSGEDKLILLPCEKKGIAGMYDSVSKSFFENSGSGSLTLLN